MTFIMSRTIMSLFVLSVLQLLVLNILLSDTAKKGYSSIVCASEHPSSLTTAYEAVKEGQHYYAVVIDAGSTGSRSFVFNITETLSGEINLEENEVSQRPERHIISLARKKERPGLSTFGTSSSDEIVHYIASFLIDAASVIPEEYHSTTQVFIKGTAGMRLLDENQQEYIWTSLYEGLPLYETAGKKAIPFPILQQNLGIISGHSEAFYAVLSSNFIEGSIDSNLNPVAGKTMVGAMDMGGSSTQLVFYNGSAANAPISKSSFWSHSWLNFGVEIIKEKVLSHMVDKYIATTEDLDPNIAAISEDTRVEIRILENPCGQADHEHDFTSGFRFRGTADVEYCMEIIQSVVWPTASSSEDRDAEEKESSAPVQCSYPEGVCPVDNVKHPSIGDQRFYGMSVYYYAFDCVRQLGSQQLSAWPQPSINELKVATKEFCSMSWNELLEKFNGEDRHKYTRSAQLPFRCLEALYMVTLLERGFGFPADSRQITLALEVQGREVEWTLGFALAEIRNPSAGAVPFPSTSREQKDGGEKPGEEEGKGQEGKEEEEITPVYREVLGAVFDGAAVSQQEQGNTTTTLDSYGLTITATMKKIAAAASKALRNLLLQMWDSARAALIELRRWISAAITRRN